MEATTISVSIYFPLIHRLYPKESFEDRSCLGSQGAIFKSWIHKWYQNSRILYSGLDLVKSPPSLSVLEEDQSLSCAFSEARCMNIFCGELNYMLDTGSLAFMFAKVGIHENWLVNMFPENSLDKATLNMWYVQYSST